MKMLRWWLLLFAVSLGRTCRAFVAVSFHTRSTSSSFRSQGTMTQRSAIVHDSLLLLTSASEIVVSPEPIHTAFSVATFLPQPFWLLMIALPNARITKQVMGGMGTYVYNHRIFSHLTSFKPAEVPIICAAVHFFIVVASLLTDESATAPLAEFNDVFDPAGDPQAAFFGMTSSYPNFVAEEWSHVLTWDLFVGRWVWLHGLNAGVWTGPAVLLCNLIGPPGLLLYAVQCSLTGVPLVEKEE